MSRSEYNKLEAILSKIEALQNETKDPNAKDRLGLAKSELLRLHSQAAFGLI